jgi:hypothetical protein
MTGATKSMSSWQCRGGLGISSLATVMRTSVPHNEQRKPILTLRSSPAGGGRRDGAGEAADDAHADAHQHVDGAQRDEHLPWGEVAHQHEEQAGDGEDDERPAVSDHRGRLRSSG